MACCKCFEGLLALGRPPEDHEAARDSFERTVAFLGSVPLFKKQLPRSELPKVAQNLTRRVWQPGQRLVKQGETGRAFFLIESGEALVITEGGPGEAEEIRASLCAGDYFGGHTLTTERPNVATIIAAGPDVLVTLSMSRADFEHSPLKRFLRFPKRPAIYDVGDDKKESTEAEEEPHTKLAMPRGSSSSRPPTSTVAPSSGKSADEEEFIRQAVSKNINLRALLQASSDKISAIAQAAERQEVPKGTCVARSGEFGNEFFVVREGAFEVDLADEPEQDGNVQQSAELLVERSTMAERLLRKQHFLQSLAGGGQNAKTPGGRAASINVVPVNRTLDSKSINPNRFSGGPKRKNSRRTTKGLTTSIGGEKSAFSVSTESSSSLGSSLPETLKAARATRRYSRRADSDLSTESASPKHSLDQEPGAVLGVGESFGELSLLYNTRREATFRASEDSVVYVVGRRKFRDCFNRRGARFQEYIELLEEVRILNSLLSAERYELACNAAGFLQIAPGERILYQGKVRKQKMWYVLERGSVVITQTKETDEGPTTLRIGELHRAGHFGERSLLRGDTSSNVTIDAGPHGCTCLTFDADVIFGLLRSVFKAGDGNIPPLTATVEEWFTWKTGGFERQISTASNRLGTSEGRLVSLQTLKFVSLLGRGGYGQVKLVEDVKARRCYALKALSKGYICSKGAEQLVQWEKELLGMVRSPFVIRLHNCFVDEQCVYFLLEAALGGCLIDVIREHFEVLRDDTPRGSAAAFYVACLTEAVEHLHERCIVHRDLKPENVLLDERGYAKLCDMGFARFVLGKTNTLAGTPEYMAPEMIDFPHGHDMKVDWWALGVVTYELLGGQTPFEDEGISEPMERLLALRRSQERDQLQMPYYFPAMARLFIKGLLKKLPGRLGTQRGASEIREHAMFTAIKFNWKAFHSQQMAAPYASEWLHNECVETDDLGMSHAECGSLGIDEGDPLFVPYSDDMGLLAF